LTLQTKGEYRVTLLGKRPWRQ